MKMDRRNLRPSSEHLLRPGIVERARSHPEGTHLRPYRQRRQSRRGREGILLLSRQHADAFLHEVSVQVSAGGISLRRIGGREPAARIRTSLSIELLDTGVFNENRYFDVFVEYAKADVEDILIKITVTNRGPEAANLHLLPTIWFRNTWSWGSDRRVGPNCISRAIRAEPGH